MGIVSAILLSVVIAFTCGTVVMYISRTIFSFRYTALFRRYGSLWCGASLTAIVYFALFKGLKTVLAGLAFIRFIDQHLLLSLFICWVGCSLLLFFIQRLKINILRITILATGFEVSDLTFKGEYGGDADEHIAQSQYIVLRPDQLDNNALIEKLENAPAYDRPKDFRDNFEGGEKRKEEPTSNRRSIKF